MSAKLFIEQPTTMNPKFSRKERIAILETQVAMLRERATTFEERYHALADRFQTYVGERIAAQEIDPYRFVVNSGGIAGPIQGLVCFGELRGNPVLCWLSGGHWWYRASGDSEHKRLEWDDANDLIWYKKIF